MLQLLVVDLGLVRRDDLEPLDVTVAAASVAVKHFNPPLQHTYHLVRIGDCYTQLAKPLAYSGRAALPACQRKRPQAAAILRGRIGVVVVEVLANAVQGEPRERLEPSHYCWPG
jgi:hypothetical protein